MKVKKCEKREKAFAIAIPTAVLQMQSENVLGYLIFVTGFEKSHLPRTIINL